MRTKSRLFRIGQCFAVPVLTLVMMPDRVNAQGDDLQEPADHGGRLRMEEPGLSIWQNGVGNGFRAGTESIGLGLEANYGISMFGGRESHRLALASLSYGYVLDSVHGKDHWYRGNWELRGELFSGAEYSPKKEWLVGLTPHLRHEFSIGTRCVPFVDIGAGVTATSIGPPDLSGTFEFNLQACVGTHWFIEENVALTMEVRYLHMSCAGLHDPNLGLNGVTGMAGLTFFF
ncbi:MAG: putative exported protein [Pedosphaera sp.]|nr:putative exported protein [Pedosphaera sp.]